MNWTFVLIAVPTVCYVGAAFGFYSKGNVNMAVVYAGYSLANLGFLWEALK